MTDCDSSMPVTSAVLSIDWPQRLRLPIVCAPMFLVTGPEMVIAACRAGIVGALPAANARPIERLEAWMMEITDSLRATGTPDAESWAPWAFNLMTHRSNSRLDAELELVERFQPPLVITALGSPRPATEIVRGYGGRVIADVPSVGLARKAAAAGVDGLACICTGAGGHTGNLSPFAFVSAVREFFDGLIVLGGGIADGYGVAGAIASGADLVYMGTRFIASTQSMAPPAYKQMLVDCTLEDLVVSAGITGTPASWLKPSLSAAGLDPNDLPPPPERNYDGNRPFTARRWVDTWSAGQGLNSIRMVSDVAEIVAELEQDWQTAMQRLARRIDHWGAPLDTPTSGSGISPQCADIPDPRHGSARLGSPRAPAATDSSGTGPASLSAIRLP